MTSTKQNGLQLKEWLPTKGMAFTKGNAWHLLKRMTSTERN